MRGQHKKLNQQLSTMQQNIQDLKFKREELKGEGIIIMYSTCTYYDFHIV